MKNRLSTEKLLRGFGLTDARIEELRCRMRVDRKRAGKPRDKMRRLHEDK